MMRPVVFLIMAALAALCISYVPQPAVAMTEEGEESSLRGASPGTSAATNAEESKAPETLSDDEASSEATEITRTLGQGDWLRFRDFSLQLMSVDKNKQGSMLNDSVELYVSGPEGARIIQLKELHFAQFGLYEIFVERAVPSEGTSAAMATIRVRYRSFYVPRYRLTPTPLPPAKWPERPPAPVPPEQQGERGQLLSFTRWMRVGQDLQFRDLAIRLARVYENNPNDRLDDSARLIVRTPISSRDLYIEEYHSEFIDDYEIAVVEVVPSGEPGQGKAQIQIRYRNP
jgi:hypothetical protein